jgi:hypothetical protein
MNLKIDVSIGEVLDKISILEIKASEIKDSKKLANIYNELQHLKDAVKNVNGLDTSDIRKLYEINKTLWDVEDDLRYKESIGEFDADFIDLARSVYMFNDQRAELKKDLNIKYGSTFIEEKSYKNTQ